MSRQTVIIASADSYQTKLLQDWLENAGFQVRIINRGDSAPEIIRKEKANLLILDWMLPDSSTLEVIQKIRSGEVSFQLPIILIGDMKEEDRLLGLRTGADLCLAESLHSKVFIARVCALMRRSSAVGVLS